MSVIICHCADLKYSNKMEIKVKYKNNCKTHTYNKVTFRTLTYLCILMNVCFFLEWSHI